jgi:hypothetical protein
MRRLSSLALLLATGAWSSAACVRAQRDEARPEPAPAAVPSAAPPPSTSPSASASTERPSPEATREEVRTFLARYAVDDDAPVRRILYTWTTGAQLEELAKGEVLLSRSESASYGPSGFDRVMADRPPGDALARLLGNEAYAKKRFAWPAPWSTVSGLAGTPYGDRLVRIELGDDAIVLRHVLSSGAWDGFDMKGAHVDEATILAHPERLAAVYFVSDVSEPGRPAYREYVLLNESQIASWSYGDAADEKLLVDAAGLLERLPATPPGDLDGWTRALVPRWRGGAGGGGAKPGDVYAAWSSTLAFATPDHAPERTRLDAIVRRLRAAPRSTPPKTHRPTLKFALTYHPPRPLRPAAGSRSLAT